MERTEQQFPSNLTPVTSRRRLLRLCVGATFTLPLLAACGDAAAVTAGSTSVAAAVTTTAASSAATSSKGAASATMAETTAASAATSSASAKVAASGTKLVFGSWVDSDQDKQLYQGMIDGFNKSHHDIAVTFEATAGGTSAFLEKFSSQLAAGTPPDVFNMYYPWVQNLGDKNVFLNLDPLIAAAHEDMSDFFPNALDAFKYKDHQIAMPHYAGPSVCYLNKTAFDKAGVALPSNDWTWDDFLDVAQKLTKPGGSAPTFGVKPISTDLNWINAQIWEDGGNEFSDDLSTSRLTEEPAVSAFQYIIDLTNKQHVSPNSAETKGKDTNEMFHHGEIAMVVNTCRCNVPLYLTYTDVQLASAPLPQGKVGLVSRDGPNAIAIGASTKQQDAGWQVANYFASPEGQTAFLATHRSVPTRKAFLDSKAFKDSLLPWESLDVYKTGMETERPGQYPANWVEINKAVGDAIKKALSGQTSAVSALQAVNAQVNSLLKG